MKFKLIDLRMMEKSLKKIVERDMPIITAYRLGKFYKEVSVEMQVLERSRYELINKYGSKVKNNELSKNDNNLQPSQIQNNQPILRVDPSKEAEFYENYNKLLQEEINIEFDPVLIKDFGDISLSAVDMICLEKIIKDETVHKKITKKKKNKSLPSIVNK